VAGSTYSTSTRPSGRRLQLHEPAVVDCAIELRLDFAGATELGGELPFKRLDEGFQSGHAGFQGLNPGDTVDAYPSRLRRGAG
jgi:hypothetical protein